MYAKVFSQIFDSSIANNWKTRHVFEDLLKLADINGVVDMTHEAIAARTRMPLEIIQEAIAELESPDPRSRTPDAEGRRIERLDDHRDWGWLIVNYQKFREISSEEQRREKTRNRVTAFRLKHKELKTENQPVTQCNASETPSNAVSHMEMERQRQIAGESAGRPSIAEVLATAQMIGLVEWKARDWFDEMEGCGWLDFQHRPVVRWQSIMNRVKVKWEADGRPSAPPSNGKLPSGAARKLSVLDIKSVISAKEERCVVLKGKHCAEGPLSSEWNSEPARLEYKQLRGETNALKAQLSKMA